MNTPKMGPTGPVVSSLAATGDSFVGRVVQRLYVALATGRGAGKQTERSTDSFPEFRPFARPQFLRVAIKVRGKILFINLGEIVSVRAKGKYIWLQGKTTSYLLRESISAVAEKLYTHGFIRIHRSVLVNTSFVEEIRPLSTGEYCLRVEGGKEYTVTRT